MVDLYPHQLDALREIRNGTILKGGVGTGKSRTALAYYYAVECGGRFPLNGKGAFQRMQRPRDIYVVTTAKKRDSFDWETEASTFGLGSDATANPNSVVLTVDSWNNISAYEGVKDAFFVFDEQRLIGNGSWVKSFYKIAKNNHWIMLSATPGDNWMDYIPVFVANGFYKNRTEFVRRHVVYSNFTTFPKIDRYTEEAYLNQLRKKLLVEMPYLTHTVRHVFDMLCDYDTEKWDRVVKDRWNIYEDRPIKDAGELFIVMRKLINTDPSRLAAIMVLMEKHPKLIVFYNYNYELEMLRTLMDSLNQTYTEWNGHRHEAIPASPSWVYLVQYTAGAEGWNCIETDSTAYWSLNYSYRITSQSRGRIDRLNTPFTDLYYYVLRSMSPLDNAIVTALHGKKNFNEGQFFGQILGQI